MGYFGHQLMAFDSTPGAPASAPVRWPKQTSFTRVAGRKQLLMFVHPECTCSIASLEQLRNLQKMTAERLDMRVVLWGRPATNSSGRNWRQEIGSAALFEDRDGSEARLFGAKTSGQTLIYDEVGNLIYSGGVTVFRGEGGGEPILRRIMQTLNNADRRPSFRMPVFGCPITDPGELASSFEPKIKTWNSHLQ